MQKGDKFIIEVGDVVKDSNGKKYAKIKGFNTLMFDDQGIDKLKRLESYPRFIDLNSEMSYNLGYNKGLEQGWLLAQRLAETTIHDLCQMGLYYHLNWEVGEYQASCQAIVRNSVQDVANKVMNFDSNKQAESL